MIKSWEELGTRVRQARESLGLTQTALAERLELDRTVISKIEAGTRNVNTLELARLAEHLQRSIGWFLRDPLPSVVSRRATNTTGERFASADALLEELAYDVEQLIGLDLLRTPPPRSWKLTTVDDAERVAREVRGALELSATEPAWDLSRLFELLGLYLFVLPLPLGPDAQDEADGSYLALQAAGVALIDGSKESGRRRFTAAHELGHHVFQDQYAEWSPERGTSETERVINAFAIHFLLPRAGVGVRWKSLSSSLEPRIAAMHLGVEFGVSWTAVCAQLHRLQQISSKQHDQMVESPPRYADYSELSLRVRDDLRAPMVPPQYEAAVFRGARSAKLGHERALELLRGAVNQADLPDSPHPPLGALTPDLVVF